jgi:hypothetical protein
MVPAILPAKWCFAEDLKSDIPDVPPPAIRLSGRMDGRLKSPLQSKSLFIIHRAGFPKHPGVENQCSMRWIDPGGA